MIEIRPLLEKLEGVLRTKFPQVIRENKGILAITTVIFLTLVGIAVAAEQAGDNPVRRAIEDQTESYREKLKRETRVERTQLEWTAFYLRNNLTLVIQTIGFGVGFSLFPLYSLFRNGLAIGYIASGFDLSLTQTFSILLPHSVFELTGYLIAIVCGLKLGIGSIKCLIERSFDPLREQGEDVKYLIPPAMILIIIAGFIEGFISPYIAPGLNFLKIIGSLGALTLIILWMGGEFLGPAYDSG